MFWESKWVNNIALKYALPDLYQIFSNKKYTMVKMLSKFRTSHIGLFNNHSIRSFFANQISPQLHQFINIMESLDLNVEDDNILWTHFVVSSSCFNLGRFHDARHFAEKAVRINPEHFDSHFVLASICASEGDLPAFESAYHQCVRLMEKHRQHPELLAGLVVNKISEKWRLDLDYGNLLLMEGRDREAQLFFDVALDQVVDKPSVLRSIIMACREKGNHPLAREYLDQALEAGLDSRTAAFERALLSKASGDQAGYKKIIRDLLICDMKNSPELGVAVGTEALKLGMYPEAESMLHSAVQQSYEHPGVLISLALACKYQGKTEEAAQWNLRVLDLDPQDINALANLGHLYFDQEKWETAKSYYERALQYKKEQSDVLFRLSLIALMAHDLEQCVRYCDDLLGILGIPCNMVLESIADLALIYRTIGDTFHDQGNRSLHLEAARFAKALEIYN